MGDYRLRISGKTNGLYTLTIWSKTKTTDEALKDFTGSQELSSHSTEDSTRKARIPMAKLEDIVNALRQFNNKAK